MTLSPEFPPVPAAAHLATAGLDARPSLAIIGLGRVGTVLGQALKQAGYRIVAVSSRVPEKARAAATALGAQATTPARAARAAELTLLTISDDAIPAVAAELAQAGAWRQGKAVIHASGVSPAGVLAPAAQQGAAIGAFHPLAAFARPDMPLPQGLTFAIEAQGTLHQQLWAMATALGGQPLNLAPEDKTLYHAAAVIASNYTVTLTSLAVQLFERMEATPEQALRALLPLMRTTLDNMERQGVPQALTGPLLRGDVSTVRQHLLALDEAAPQVALLYRCLAAGTLPLAQQRGLESDMAGAPQDTITLPGELLIEQEV